MYNELIQKECVTNFTIIKQGVIDPEEGFTC